MLQKNAQKVSLVLFSLFSMLFIGLSSASAQTGNCYSDGYRTYGNCGVTVVHVDWQTQSDGSVVGTSSQALPQGGYNSTVTNSGYVSHQEGYNAGGWYAPGANAQGAVQGFYYDPATNTTYATNPYHAPSYQPSTSTYNGYNPYGGYQYAPATGSTGTTGGNTNTNNNSGGGWYCKGC